MFQSIVSIRHYFRQSWIGLEEDVLARVFSNSFLRDKKKKKKNLNWVKGEAWKVKAFFYMQLKSFFIVEFIFHGPATLYCVLRECQSSELYFFCLFVSLRKWKTLCVKECDARVFCVWNHVQPQLLCKVNKNRKQSLAKLMNPYFTPNRAQKTCLWKDGQRFTSLQVCKNTVSTNRRTISE